MELNWISEKLGLPGFARQMKEMGYEEIIALVGKGRPGEAAERILENTWQQFSAEMQGIKELFLLILLLGIFSALCIILMQTFQNRQIADVAYFISSLLVLTVITTCFKEAAEIAGELLDRLIALTTILVPTFMAALVLAAGSMTAIGYHQILLGVLYLVQYIIGKAGIPAAELFLILHIMNSIWDEDRLSGITGLMKKAIAGSMKLLLTAIAGISVMQSMITPVLERIKSDTAGRLLSSIPGFGGLAEGAAGMLLGSAVLVKNGLGVVSILALTALCSYPFLKIGLFAGMFKLSAGLMALAADKRIVNCLDGAGDAMFLLLRILFTAAGCFIVVFAIITCLAGST